jgi:outer membrane lipoprotein SlyB
MIMKISDLFTKYKTALIAVSMLGLGIIGTQMLTTKKTDNLETVTIQKSNGETITYTQKDQKTRDEEARQAICKSAAGRKSQRIKQEFNCTNY